MNTRTWTVYEIREAWDIATLQFRKSSRYAVDTPPGWINFAESLMTVHKARQNVAIPVGTHLLTLQEIDHAWCIATGDLAHEIGGYPGHPKTWGALARHLLGAGTRVQSSEATS